MEIIELEESLHQLEQKITELEVTNEFLFNQKKNNKQRFDQQSEKITKLINECETKYNYCLEQRKIAEEEYKSLKG